MPLAAVIGAGPSGFYATEQLLRAGFEVDLYDLLPTPYGLVRGGVAPDHPKISRSRASTPGRRRTRGSASSADERRGLIPNAGGRVLGPGGEPLPGEYAVGWIKRGPSGVIGTNKKDAAETTAQIVADAESDRLGAPAAADRAAIAAWLRERVPGLVTWDGWQAIDEHEVGAGASQGRPRVKLVRVGEMLDVARGQSAAAGATRFASRRGSVKPAAARAATPAVANAARGSAS